MEHDLFEMRFTDAESNAWIPRFLKGMGEAVIFNWGDAGAEYALNELCDMEKKLNELSEEEQRQFY